MFRPLLITTVLGVCLIGSATLADQAGPTDREGIAARYAGDVGSENDRAAALRKDVLRSDLGPAHVHGTTRGHQRKVVYLHGAWIVAYSNEHGSHLRLSRDGLHWTEPLTFHHNKTSSSYTLVCWQQRLLLFYTDFQPDSPRRQWTGDGIAVRDVVVRDGRLELGAQPQPALVDPHGTDFYLSAAVGPGGWFWVQSRHVDRRLPEEQMFQDTRVASSVEPGCLAEWTEPVNPLPARARGSVVPLIVPLPDGKAYAFARTYREVATKANRLWGGLFDGERWSDRPSLLAEMSDVLGDDRRMSAVFDPATGVVHVVYVDAEGTLRHRQLLAPYGEREWRPSLSQPGTVVHRPPVHCAVASLDRHGNPSRVYVVFGRELRVGRDRRHRTGELDLAVLNGHTWSVAGLPVSEPGSDDNWYPNTAAEVNPSGELGVLYLQGPGKGPHRARFALLRLRPPKTTADTTSPPPASP